MLLREAAAQAPDSAGVLALLVTLLQRLNRLDEAAEPAAALVRLEPGHVRWWHQLAALERQRQRPEAELAALRRLTEIEPAAAAQHDRISVLLEQAGDHAGALAAARVASALAPDAAQWRGRVAVLERKV